MRVILGVRAALLAAVGLVAAAATSRKVCGFNFVDSNNTVSRTNFTEELASLEAMANQTAANTVTIVIMNFQEDAHSTSISYNTSCCTKSEDHILQLARRANELGLGVTLKPQVLFTCNRLNSPPTCVPWTKGNWRGKIGENPAFTAAEWSAWFASYTEMITYYARIAAKIDNMKSFVVGTELPSTARKDEEWAAVSEAVRATFRDAGWRGRAPFVADVHATSPPLQFAASWDASFTRNFSSFDLIGVDAYVPLDNKNDPSSATPSEAALVEAWKSTWVPQFRNLSSFWGSKPLGFTEIGYASSTYCGTQPARPVTTTQSLECQANAYAAVYDALGDEPWWSGVQWWSWDSWNNPAPAGDLSLAVRGKPAEQVVKQGCSRIGR